MMWPGFEGTVDVSVSPTSWDRMLPGVVVDARDPDKLGRVRVRVPQVYGDPTEDEFIADDMLPWARPAFPTHDFHVPDVGDGVWVSFYGGDARCPIWHGQYLGSDDAPDEFTSAYSPEPKTRLLRTSGGHTIELRWVSGEERISIKSKNGRQVEISDADNSLTLETEELKLEMLDDTTKVSVGTSAVKYLLVDERHFLAWNALMIKLEANIAIFNAHVHAPSSPTTTPMSVLTATIAPGSPAPYNEDDQKTASLEAN